MPLSALHQARHLDPEETTGLWISLPKEIQAGGSFKTCFRRHFKMGPLAMWQRFLQEI